MSMYSQVHFHLRQQNRRNRDSQELKQGFKTQGPESVLAVISTVPQDSYALLD